MKKNIVLGGLLALLSILLAACAGSGANSAPVTSISVEMSEFKFSPSDLVVAAGQEITLNLSNDGAVEHDFRILKKGVKASTPFDPEKQAADILFEARLGAGKSDKFTFTLPEAGEYQVICGIQGHMEAGMVAKITAK